MISIIVPVYNTEKYLDQCIRSVLVQTYTNWELLLIDDGSTDSSGAICDKYAAEDNRIKVVHKPNTGVSDSKNIALDMAKGEYIMFLDSDDYWCINDCIAQLYAKSQELGVDIVRGEYKAVDEAGNLLFERTVNASKQQAVNKLLTPYQFLTEIIQGEFFLSLSLFKKFAIGDIRFNSGRKFMEDTEIYCKILSKHLQCFYSPLCFYCYRKHASAATANHNIRILQDSFELCDVFAILGDDAASEDLQNYYRYNAVMMYYWTLDTLSNPPYYSKRNKIVNALRLNRLQKRVLKNVFSHNIYNKCMPIFLFPPIVSIQILRLKALCFFVYKCIKARL